MGYNVLRTSLEGDVEIDESLFGRKLKYYNKGKPKGHRICNFGITGRSFNCQKFYLVDNRDASTLIPIIQSLVYTDVYFQTREEHT